MNEVFFDRFYIEDSQFEKYEQLENDSYFPLRNHPEIFLLSACIGYKNNLRYNLDKKKQLTQKSSVLNLDYAIEIYNSFKIITEINNELDEDKKLKVNTLIEEYAKGGFDKLYNDVLSSNKPINNKEKLISYILLYLQS